MDPLHGYLDLNSLGLLAQFAISSQDGLRLFEEYLIFSSKFEAQC